MNVDHLISTYGYSAVFVLVVIESLGVPLPGETAVISAGIYAGQTHKLSVWVIWVVASAAAVTGGSIGFVIGDKGGYRLVRRYGPKVHFDAAKLKVGMYVFDRHGSLVVFLGRFVSLLRTYAAFLAGTNKMPWRRFLVANAAGGVIWAAIYAFASYEAGKSLRNVSGTVNYVLIAAAAVALVIAFFVVRRKTKQLEAVAEAAYPGPLPD
ncbi:MAG TPA: DedA family protein [Acidimicrobiales bacterium]|nr:DedA family protein [Acidimicrobiales bacterium]